VKAAIVSLAIKNHNSGGGEQIKEFLLHTGQHYDPVMSDIFFAELGLKEPDLNLNVGSGRHGEMTGLMLKKIEDELLRIKPDLVLVYGDTNSTLAGALAAAKLVIPLAHVEAGLRSGDRSMPEEVNRIVTDQLSNLLLCPTKSAIKNLEREGINQNVVHVGDVMYDAALIFGSKQLNLEELFGVRKGEYILCTLHRAVNTDVKERLLEILRGLKKLAQDLPVVFPIHPRTTSAIERHDLMHLTEALIKIPPVSYTQMAQLEKGAKLVITDSGGVQKEAYFHGVPCITVRDSTEWNELIDAGWNTLCRADAEAIVTSCAQARRGRKIDEFGDGAAGREVVTALTHFLNV
jgi:UDP-GlcNAc3NAcA epimerase